MKKKNSSANESKGAVKHADPRMAYSSTKPEMLIATTNYKIGDIFPDLSWSKDTAVIAEDQNGLYVTGKSNVGAALLDGNRMYRRDKCTVTKTDTGFIIETGGISRTV